MRRAPLEVCQGAKEGREAKPSISVRSETPKAKILEFVEGGWTPGHEDQFDRCCNSPGKEV